MAYEYADFPNGFSPGVVIKEVLGADFIPGKIFYVGNNATKLKGEADAADSSDLRGGTFFKPFSTIDHAYNQCKANRNDVILVRPAHTLSIADATTLVMDTAGVHIVGMGSGENRPVITFATATSAAIPVTGANNSLANMVFKCNIASQNHMLDVAADDFKVLNCDFREGTATGLAFITADTADGDSDRMFVKNCRFHMPTAGNGAAAIQLSKDFTGVRIEDCDIYGDFDNAALEIPAGGNAQVNLLIKDCSITNLLTGVHAIEINGTSSTGKIIRCYCQGDTLGTIVDAGGLEMYEVYEHAGTDQGQANPVGTAPDSAENFIGVDDSNNVAATTNVAANEDGSILERLEQIQEAVNIGTGTSLGANKSLVDALGTNGVTLVDDAASIVGILGVDDANNAFASTNVVANLDGSILERLEAMMDPLGGYDPVLGFRVTKTSNLADGSGTDNLFTVTGRCLITHLSGEVTTVVATTTTMKLRDITNSVDLCAATTITTDAVGTMYSLPGLSAEVLNGTGGTPVIGSVPNVTTPAGDARQIIGDVQAALTIAHVLDAAGTGAVAWVLYYKPLTASSTIVAAA